MTQVFKIISTLLLSVILFVGSLFLGMALNGNAALAKPVTPDSAAYTIDHASSSEAAGRSIKQQARDYKQELDKDTNYTPRAIKNAAQRSQNAINHASERLGEKTRELSDRASNNSDELAQASQNKLQRAADNVREKLNLDEPIPQSTKDFFNDVQEKVGETFSPAS